MRARVPGTVPPRGPQSSQHFIQNYSIASFSVTEDVNLNMFSALVYLGQTSVWEHGTDQPRGSQYFSSTLSVHNLIKLNRFIVIIRTATLFTIITHYY